MAEEEKKQDVSNIQNVYTGFMKSLTTRVMSHIFTFDFEVIKISVSVGQILMSLGGVIFLMLGGLYVFQKFGGTSTLLPALIIGAGIFGLLVMSVLNKGVTPRSKISSMLQDFASDKNRTNVKMLYTGITPDKKGYLHYEDGRIGRLFLVDGVLAKTTMVAPLEMSAQAREANYLGREDSVQEDNYTLVSTLNRKEALDLIKKGIQEKRKENLSDESSFYEPFMALQEKMMKITNTSILNQFMILTSETEEELENEVYTLGRSGALTGMQSIDDYKDIKKTLAEIAFFAE